MSSKNEFEFEEIESYGKTVVWYYEEQRELYNSPNEVLLPIFLDEIVINKIKRRY